MKRRNRYHTRSLANKGVRLPLLDPVTGKETGDWLQILGVDSDVCRQAKTGGSRELLQVSSRDDKTDEDVEEVLERWKSTQIASLVIDWSFAYPSVADGEEQEVIPCTLEAVMEFLLEAPQIGDAIDRAATKRSLFFKDEPTHSTTTPEQSST